MERRRRRAGRGLEGPHAARGTRIAAVFPDGPQRYLGTVYDDDYCAAHGLLDAPPAPEPDLIGSLDEKEVTRWTRCATVVDPLTLGGETARDGSGEQA